MNSSKELLEAVKRRHGLTSDYQLHKRYGISRQLISAYMNGAAISDATSIRVADDLGLAREVVLAAMAAQRARTSEARKAWSDAVKRLGGIAAGLVLALGAGGPPPSAGAATVTDAAAQPRPCVLWKVRQKRRQRAGWADALGAAARGLAAFLAVRRPLGAACLT